MTLKPLEIELMSHTTNYTPEKLYYTGAEASKELGITVGMCYYWRGKVHGNTKHKDRRFTLNEITRIKLLIK
jgi:hypothetical protein